MTQSGGSRLQEVIVTEMPTAAGSAKDGGPAGTVTQTYIASNDMTTAAAITPAPAAGQYIKALDLLVSNLSDADIDFTVQMETTNNILAKVPIKSNSSHPITLRGYLKGDAVAKKLFGKASAAGEVTITANTISEA